jgi:hypothetical protein
MEFTEETVRKIGDKDLKHYFEVAVLEQYWGKERKSQIELLGNEMTRRGLNPEEVRRVLLERAPKLDRALEALWKGERYEAESSERPK